MISQIIKEKRSKLKLSQKEVSDYLNISIQRLNNFENESRIPSLEFLGPLSIILDFSIDFPHSKQNDKSLEFDVNIFKTKIKEYRLNNNYSLYDFGKLLNITRQTLSKYEKGEALPNINDFYKICKIINVRPSSLVCTQLYISNKKRSNLILVLLPLIIVFSFVAFFLFTGIKNNFQKTSSNSDSTTITSLSSPIYNKGEKIISDDLIDFLNETIEVYNKNKEVPNNNKYNIYFNDPNIKDFSFIHKENAIFPFYFDNEKYIDHYLLNGKKLTRLELMDYEYDLFLTPVYITYEDYFNSLKYEVSNSIFKILDIKKECSMFIVPSSIYGIKEFEIVYINDDVTTFICDKSSVIFNTKNINKIPDYFFINAEHIEFIDSPTLSSEIDIVAIKQFANYKFSSNFMTYNQINFLYVSSNNTYEYFLFFNNLIHHIYTNEFASEYLYKFLNYKYTMLKNV